MTAGLLSAVQLAVEQPRLLLLDRFYSGAGWAEVLLLTLYSGFLAKKFCDPQQARIWRPRIWRIFSVVFFAQLIIGLCGVDHFLMTGNLHLPIPAMIAAGPLYRGSGFFMPILFLSTIILVGPAWCSHLCYIGAWDDLAARARKRPQAPWRWQTAVRISLLLLVVAAAILLRMLGATPGLAASIAIAFGLGGVAVMLLLTRRVGVMVHCTIYCPIGLLANLLGKISLFRLRIGSKCNDCGICTRHCRYAALSKEDISRRRPAISCTLCGDCIASCKSAQIEYGLLRFSSATARAVFIVMIVSLHAVFLGVARL
ncbi:MAG: 4Fe-4S binding protein [Deltaproteobacteria bacterium]|nr:4Fe-4S binding protein [Deltaproteobacteria bacterium]